MAGPRGRWPVRFLAPLLALLALAGCAPDPVGDCALVMVAQTPLQVQNRLLTVPVGINGKWVRLIVDSGAERTTLSEDAANRLGLARDQRYVSRSVGVGGTTMNADARIEGLVMGGVRFPVERIAVGRFGFGGATGLAADGLLGADILLAFDLDIDVPDGTLRLYRVRRCIGASPPWSGKAVPVLGVSARKDRLMIPIVLDGVAGSAILDTGAQATTIGIEMARRLGLDERTMAGDPVVHHRGAGPDSIAARIHRFRELRIGPAIVRDVGLSVLPADVGIGDALVGQDFLHGRRVWLSFPTRQMFVSPLAHEVAAAP